MPIVKYQLLKFAFLAVILVLLIVASPVQAADPTVRAVLFFSPYCGHCEDLIQNDLPPLQEKYSDRLVIAMIDVSQPSGQALYQKAIDFYRIPQDRLGVPTMIAGEQVMVGSREIPELFPQIIEERLAAGGLDWPNLPGLLPEISNLNTNENTDLQSPSELEDASQEVTQEPLMEPEPVQDSSWLAVAIQRFQHDIPGNTLAVAVLIGMLVSLVWVGYRFVMGEPSRLRQWPDWVFPLLSLIGLGVAIYLTFIETTNAEAICGPIGDCNTVQQSPYSLIFGFLPVGLLGALGYLTILGLWIIQRFLSTKWQQIAWLAIWGMAIFGVLFSIYLTFLEPFVIGATCIWCITSAIVITLLMVATTPKAEQASSLGEQSLEN